MERVLLLICHLVLIWTKAVEGCITQLGNGERSVGELTCGNTAADSASAIEWSHDGIPITVDNDKYTTNAANGNYLIIHRVEASDEGSYSCHYQQQTAYTECLHVLGYAVFAKCENRSCPDEEVRVNVGDPITFNIGISFVGAGAANRNQKINALFLRRADATVIARGTSMAPYVINETITATIESRGMYTVTVEAVDPENGNTDSFSRYFVVAVETIQPSPLQGIPMTSMPPTLDKTSASSLPATILSGSSLPATTPSLPATGSSLPAIIIPVVLVIFIAILLLGVGTLMFIAYSKKKDFWPSTCSYKKTVHHEFQSDCLRPDPVGKEQYSKNAKESDVISLNEPDNIDLPEQAINESDGDDNSSISADV